MQLTIVEPDNLVLIDQRPQTMNLIDFDVPENLHALQWQNDKGHIELSNQLNEDISTLPKWTTAIITEHERLTELQKEQEDEAAKENIHISNGQARQERMKKQDQEEQIVINDSVRRKLT